MNRRILVIGGIAAGPSAAAKARRTDPHADIVLIEQGDDISSAICEMPYYVGGVFDDPKLLNVLTPEKFESEKHVKVWTRHYVSGIDRIARMIEVTDLNTRKHKKEHYDRLIIATGSRPQVLGLNGENARNVFHIKSLEGTMALKGYIEKEHPHNAVIVGGGYIGMEMAEALSANGIRTTILHLHDSPMSTLEKETSSAIGEELEKHRIMFVPREKVLSFDLDMSNAVVSVNTETKRWTCDLVIVAAGVMPNTELAKGAGIQLGTHGGILTDQKQVTNEDSVLAAGDCCEVLNVVTNKRMYLPLATTASKQGRVAGENAAGGNAFFKGVVRAIGVKVFDLEIAHVGLGSAEAAESFKTEVSHIVSDSRISYFPKNAPLHIVAVAEKGSGRLLGANVFGRDGAILRANTLSVAIQHRMTIDDLTRFDLIYTPPFTPLWDPLLIMGNSMRKKSP